MSNNIKLSKTYPKCNCQCNCGNKTSSVIPSGGAVGDVLTKGNNGAVWTTPDNLNTPPTFSNTGFDI